MSIFEPIKAKIEVPNSLEYLFVIEPAINEVSKKGDVSLSSASVSFGSLILIKFSYFILKSNQSI